MWLAVLTKLLPPFLVVLGAGVSIFAWKKSPKQFYSDTLWLTPFGVFVWGDGLIVGPFWLLTGAAFWVLPVSLLTMVRFFLVFKLVRSAYEVIYWINHQVAKKDYRPPLFRRFSWIGPEQAGILYQLLNMVWVIFWGFGLLLSFTFSF